MRTERYFIKTLVALFNAVLATLFLIACQQSQSPAPAASTAAESKAASAEKVFVVFEGAWAIVPDPKDANSVLALAPKTKSHGPLSVVPAHTTLEAGIYDLSVPAHGAPSAVNLDPSFFRTSVDAKNVQRALDTKLERYAIRLPKPEIYLAETRHRSRAGSTYPPDASTEQNYATSVSLRYSVNTLTGFSLAGTKDVGGAFNPLLLQLDTPVMRFVIDPDRDYSDVCNAHSREAFRDLVRLLGLTVYVDFPESPSDCHKKDPQLARTTQALTGAAAEFERMASTPSENAVDWQEAGVSDLGPATRTIAHHLLAAIYFFHSDGACMAPILFGVI